MLEFKNVTKTFGSIIAIRDLSFKVEKGEFVFVTGPSGSGKTTLINLILGKLVPEAGKIIFEGKDIAALPEKELPEVRQKMGVVFQDFKVLPERTVRENIEVALAVKEVGEKEWRERVDQVLSLVGLSDRAELFPNQLSGGEKQRVSIARALVVDPDIILADEPTGNLDWDTAEGITGLFEKINKHGKTVIMATHHELIIKKLDKRVIHLEVQAPIEVRKQSSQKKEKTKKKNDKKGKMEEEED